MSCTLRPKPPYLRPLAKEPHIPAQQNETGDGSFHEGSAMNVIDFAARRQIGEGALYLDNQDEDEFAIRTYLEMKLGCNQSARGTLSPSRRRADRGASPVTMLPPQVGRRSDHAFHDISTPVRQWIHGLFGLLVFFLGFASVLILIGGAL